MEVLDTEIIVSRVDIFEYNYNLYLSYETLILRLKVSVHILKYWNQLVRTHKRQQTVNLFILSHNVRR